MESTSNCEIELCEEILGHNNIDKVPALCEKLIAYKTAIQKECYSKAVTWILENVDTDWVMNEFSAVIFNRAMTDMESNQDKKHFAVELDKAYYEKSIITPMRN